MNEVFEQPDPELLDRLYYGRYKAQIARIALLLGIFTPLDSGPKNARLVAQMVDCDEIGIKALLDYLSSLQLIEQQGDVYSLTPTSSAFLVPGKRTYAGDWLLKETDARVWEGILQAVRTGQPANSVIPFAQEAWLDSFRSGNLLECLEMWRMAGIVPRQPPGQHLLDLACGCAYKSLILALADPAMEVTCVDSEDVLEVTRDLACRINVLPQVVFQAGDVLRMDLGEQRYDAVLLGQITYYWTGEQNQELFQRVYQALKPGGKLIIDAFMASDEMDEETRLFTFLMWTGSGGAAYSFREYSNWLGSAGFRQVKELRQHLLLAHK